LFADLDDVAHGVFKLILVGEQQNNESQLQDQQDQQEDSVAHGHADRFANGAAASQERDEDHHRAQTDQNDRHESLWGEAHLSIDFDGPNALQNQHAIYNAQNADDLEGRTNRFR